jgi:hypothetical protein
LSQKVNFDQTFVFFRFGLFDFGENKRARRMNPSVESAEFFDGLVGDGFDLLEIRRVRDLVIRRAAARFDFFDQRFKPVSPRAATTTRAPRLAKSSAAILPMPLDAPKITATCSLIGFNFIFIFNFPCSLF